MRIAIIGSRGFPSYYGGFETAVRHLVPYLSDKGHHIRVYSRETTHATSVPRVSVVPTIGLNSRSLSTLTHGLSASLHAIRRCRDTDVILILNVANGLFLPLFKLLKLPTVVNVDGIEWEREKWGRLARLVFRVGANFTAKYASLVVADAVAIAERWRTQFGVDSTFIPYGGVVERHRELPEELRLSAASYVLVVARLVPENTIIPFLDSLAEVARNHVVVIVGSAHYGGDVERRVAALARQSSNVRWLGHVRDDDLLHALWQNAGVYFHGHSVGGTNPALVQAMASGAAVVARDTVFNREVLGAAGVFCAPNAEDISRAILSLMRDQTRRAQLRASAQARAASVFSWGQINARYEAALHDALNRPSKRASVVHGRRPSDFPLAGPRR